MVTIDGQEFPAPSCEWKNSPRYDDSPEAWRLVWDDWKRTNPNPWRNKRTRAKANKLLRAVRKKGWKPPTVMVDILRLLDQVRKPRPAWTARVIIPAIAKPEDF